MLYIVLSTLAIGAYAAIVVPFIFIDNTPTAIACSIGVLFAYVILYDIIFRIICILFQGKLPNKTNKGILARIHYEPHPFLPCVYKRNFTSPDKRHGDSPYPLHKGRYQVTETVRFNNFRLFADINSPAEIQVPKPEGVHRILCLGASTTGNALTEGGVVHTYPLELEQLLRQRHPDRTIEVVNGGMGARTSAEVLVHFLLSLIDMEPDVVILYLAYTDLGPSLTHDFQSDYSHARKSMGELIGAYRVRERLPDLPLATYRFLVNKIIPESLDGSIQTATTKAQPDLQINFQGVETYARNIEHIIDVCLARNIKVICATHCYHFYKQTNASEIHAKYKAGLDMENTAMRKLAQKKDVPLVDVANMIPSHDDYFVDSLHFSTEGMKKMAELVASCDLLSVGGR